MTVLVQHATGPQEPRRKAGANILSGVPPSPIGAVGGIVFGDFDTVGSREVGDGQQEERAKDFHKVERIFRAETPFKGRVFKQINTWRIKGAVTGHEGA